MPKKEKIRSMFDSIAPDYDKLNHIMSLDIDKSWRKKAVRETADTDKPLEMLYTDGAVLLGMVYALLPFTVLPLHTSIEKLDKSLLEASSDLGASRVHTFTRVILPLTMPGIFAGSIQTFIPSLGFFFISDMMGGAKTMYIGNLIKNQFLSARNWPLGAVLSIVLIVITLILMRLYTRVGSLEDMA